MAATTWIRLSRNRLDDRLEDAGLRVVDRSQAGQHQGPIPMFVQPCRTRLPASAGMLVSDELCRRRVDTPIPARRREHQAQVAEHHPRRWIRREPQPRAPAVEHIGRDEARPVQGTPRPGRHRGVRKPQAFGHQAPGELGRLANDDVGAPLACVAFEVRQHGFDGPGCEGHAVCPAQPVRVGPRRGIDEELGECLGAAGEMLESRCGNLLRECGSAADGDVVARIGHGLGQRQQRVEVSGRGQSREEDPHRPRSCASA